MAKKTAKDNLYKKGVETLAAGMTLSKKRLSLEENLKYLRELLSVDTIIDDINQEEALEFLDAVEQDIAEDKEGFETEIGSLRDDLKEKNKEIDELNSQIEELKEENDLSESIKTVTEIRYETTNVMDDFVMEALKEAYEHLTPVQIIERLKILKVA